MWYPAQYLHRYATSATAHNPSPELRSRLFRARACAAWLNRVFLEHEESRRAKSISIIDNFLLLRVYDESDEIVDEYDKYLSS